MLDHRVLLPLAKAAAVRILNIRWPLANALEYRSLFRLYSAIEPHTSVLEITLNRRGALLLDIWFHKDAWGVSVNSALRRLVDEWLEMIGLVQVHQLILVKHLILVVFPLFWDLCGHRWLNHRWRNNVPASVIVDGGLISSKFDWVARFIHSMIEIGLTLWSTVVTRLLILRLVILMRLNNIILVLVMVPPLLKHQSGGAADVVNVLTDSLPQDLIILLIDWLRVVRIRNILVFISRNLNFLSFLKIIGMWVLPQRLGDFFGPLTNRRFFRLRELGHLMGAVLRCLLRVSWVLGFIYNRLMLLRDNIRYFLHYRRWDLLLGFHLFFGLLLVFGFDLLHVLTDFRRTVLKLYWGSSDSLKWFLTYLFHFAQILFLFLLFTSQF